MLDRGYRLMAPAIAIAASLRLNANRGFNPQQFVIVADRHADRQRGRRSRRGSVALSRERALAA